MGVRQPGVHREQPGFGAKTNQDEHKRQMHQHRIQLRGVLEHFCPEDGVVGIGHKAGCVGVHQNGAEQPEGHPDGADNDVLPGRLQ
ncbi:hypothetical protein D3C78_1646560 [compost metagenome]